MRTKILSVYGLSKLTLLGFAVVVFADLHYLNEQIEAGQAVADLRRSALEMRRDEKNLFLYQDVSGIKHFSSEAATARQLIGEFRLTFVKIAGAGPVAELETLLDDYERDVIAYANVAPADRVVAREAIRKQGSELYDITRQLLRSERALLAKATQSASDFLLLALSIVVLLEIASGLYLARSVVRPLRELEVGLRDIDEGRARDLPLPSNDREIRSFVKAFNAMLRHLRRQQDQTKRNEKAAALGVLVSGVAHELNNPLSNISTSAQLLIEEGCDAEKETRELWLAQIDGETERARRIVRRLLDSVRQPRAHVGRLAMSELIESSLELVNRQIPAQVTVCVDAADDIALAVDRERMQQVFINLIKNASDAGARHIELSAQLGVWDADAQADATVAGDAAMLAQSTRAVQLIVADDGPGIPVELREKIFDPFITTHSDGEGTGLGLYLVEEIVSEHRGVIVVESPSGGGARFSVWLPILEDTP
jgi:signal transduction histidine kinase